MSHFQPGQFDKDRLGASVRAFCPIAAHLQIEDVNLEGLQKRGKKVLLLDLDNTLTTWRSEEFEPSVVAWIEKAQSMGFQLALISNSIKPDRSNRVGERFKLPVFRGRFKPSRQSYRKALAHFKVAPSEAIMLGDQLITDVLGANRSGIEAVWIGKRGGAEWGGTAINRWLEKRITPLLYKAIVPLESLPGVAPTADPEEVQTEHPQSVSKQVMRFAVVGATVWMINTALAVLLENMKIGSFSPSESIGSWMLANLPGWLHWGQTPADESRYVLWWIAALIAMFFSFWLNRTWTFGVKGRDRAMKQMQRFYLVTIIGTIFNTILASWFKQILGGQGAMTTILAQGFSAVIVAFWNFFSQRLYAFRDR